MNTYNPDVILLGDTKLNDKHKITYTNYKIHRTNRTNAKQGGGTTILIRNSIEHQKIHLTTSTNNEVLETTIIKIELHNQKKIICSSSLCT